MEEIELGDEVEDEAGDEAGDKELLGGRQLLEGGTPKTAVSIDTRNPNALTPPSFAPKHTAGPHLPPDTDMSAISLF